MARPKNTVDQDQEEISGEVDQVAPEEDVREEVTVSEPAPEVLETVSQKTGKKALAFRRLDNTFWVIVKDEIVTVSTTDPNNDICTVNNNIVKTNISKAIEALGWDVQNV